MYRELLEEVGLLPHHVKILGRTRDWLRYDVPSHWVRREWRGSYRGQKQIRICCASPGTKSDVHLRATSHPEFDGWRWHRYWAPIDEVIDFKRDVYQGALSELARFLRGLESLDEFTRPPLKRPLGLFTFHAVRKILSAKARLQGESAARLDTLRTFNAAGALLSQKIATRGCERP